jgi:type IV pilus assembly protein PilW
MNITAYRVAPSYPTLCVAQLGVSLVEIMVALVAGLILIGGVGQVYLSNKQTYRVQEAQSRLQENGRYTLELLERDVRRAGYQGCGSRGSVTPHIIANPPVVAFDTATAVTGSEATGAAWSPAVSASLGAVVAGTDTITIQFAAGCGGHLMGNMNTDNANIQISAKNTCDLEAGDVFMISDCISADIARATSVSNGAEKQTIAHAEDVNIDNRLSKAYQRDAEILRVYSYTYYIRNGQSGQPSLWQLDNTKDLGGNNPAELVEGVEDMQITYGEDTDNDGTPNQYLAANTVSNWANVRSVRINLLFRTLDNNLTTAAQAYSFNGTATTAGDRRLRRTFTATISVRNRLQ